MRTLVRLADFRDHRSPDALVQAQARADAPILDLWHARVAANVASRQKKVDRARRLARARTEFAV